jgi:hypothetical protein
LTKIFSTALQASPKLTADEPDAAFSRCAQKTHPQIGTAPQRMNSAANWIRIVRQLATNSALNRI